MKSSASLLLSSTACRSSRRLATGRAVKVLKGHAERGSREVEAEDFFFKLVCETVVSALIKPYISKPVCPRTVDLLAS